MKKSTRKTIKYLKRYEGHEIIRTKPVCWDLSHTNSRIRYEGHEIIRTKPVSEDWSHTNIKVNTKITKKGKIIFTNLDKV